MKIFNDIFSSTYNFYSKFKNENPRVSALLVVGVIQFTLMLLFIAVIRRMTGRDLIAFVPNKYYFLPIIIIWGLALNRYYTNIRSEKLLKEFDLYSKRKKRFLKIISLVLFILPGALFFIVLQKK